MLFAIWNMFASESAHHVFSNDSVEKKDEDAESIGVSWKYRGLSRSHFLRLFLSTLSNVKSFYLWLIDCKPLS